MTEDLVDGHRLKPDASQLQVCITILLTCPIHLQHKEMPNAVLAILQSILV